MSEYFEKSPTPEAKEEKRKEFLRQGNEEEFNRLRTEYDQIKKWRLEE